jgi:hypothetical protein
MIEPRVKQTAGALIPIKNRIQDGVDGKRFKFHQNQNPERNRE